MIGSTGHENTYEKADDEVRGVLGSVNKTDNMRVSEEDEAQQRHLPDSSRS
jgi:hypothetical protein